MKVYLSPSMQVHNIYATNTTNEMVQCNRIAEHAETALKRCGFDVKKAPQGQSMNDSIKESNNWGADLHIPIHTNAANGKASGTLVMVYSGASQNMAAATPIYNSVKEVTPGTTNYGIQVNSSLAELNSTKAIAVYIECDFHDNLAIAEWIIDNVKTLGEAICKGVCEYAKTPYISGATDLGTADDVYRVQVGAFRKKENAEKLAEELTEMGYDTIIK